MTGRALDLADGAGRPAWPWLGLAALGGACAAGLRRLARRQSASGAPAW